MTAMAEKTNLEASRLTRCTMIGWLYEGGLRLGPATAAREPHSASDLRMGRRFIQVLAENHLARH